MPSKVNPFRPKGSSVIPGRTTAAYRRAKAELRAMYPTGPCHLCGLPIDPEAPNNSRGQWTAEHVWALSQGNPDPDSIDSIVPAHRGCNSAAGNKLRPKGFTRPDPKIPVVRSRNW